MIGVSNSEREHERRNVLQNCQTFDSSKASQRAAEAAKHAPGWS